MKPISPTSLRVGAIGAPLPALILMAALAGVQHSDRASKAHIRLGGADFTVTAWVRTQSGGVVLSLSSPEGAWANTGKALVIRGGRIAADLCNVGIWSGQTVVTDGEWHRVGWVYTHGDRTLRFYVDGRLDGSANATAMPDTEGDILRIGMAAYGITAPNGFVGEIDDVRVYGRALSNQEMEAGAADDAVAHWPLDGDGRDVAGGGHDAVVNDAEEAPGAVGLCLRFTGSSSVAVTDPYGPLIARMRLVQPRAILEAVKAAVRSEGNRYPHGRDRVREAESWVAAYEGIVRGLERREPRAVRQAEELLRFQREVLLDDTSLDFDRILVIRRSVANLGLPANWDSNSSLPRNGYDNELAVLSDWKRSPKLTPLYKPPDGRFIGDVDLHFDADRMLASMPDDNGRWQVHELTLKGTPPTVRQLPLISEPDVDNYDACYLPDGAVIFSSTAPFVGVPCVTGSSHVANLYRAETDGRIRRLTFEQDHDWCPTAMNDGRVMYLRWEYSDLPHFVSRILFTMNPDGTNQMALYGSNSYWPNSMFYARPVPDRPTQFMAIVSGHHDTQRMGELTLFDTSIGTHEADGVVQRYPGRGKRVEPEILDGLVQHKWPKFLHPWPLSAGRCLVAAQLSPGARWGLYLADAYDNLTLIHDLPGNALLEPIPLVRRAKPPIIADRTNLGSKEATVLLTDVYSGPGLAGVPRGTVKSLRLFTYQFAYHGVGGQVHRVGLDGPWDVRRIMGTVPVQPDGSAHFRIPANTPVAVQPLDADGRALQLMRSWMTGMPGERLSCGGCHEPAGSPSVNRNTLAARRPPDAIRPWYGPTRGFNFRREVQPVLDAHCIKCHGQGKAPDLRDLPDVGLDGKPLGPDRGWHFPPAYLALRRYVRGHTIESDMHLLTPGEFHASTTHLVRMLERGHHGVKLDREGWDRLNTWIDLNTPAHGTWSEVVGPAHVAHQRKRRMEMDRRYAGIDVDPEAPLAGRPYRPTISAAAPLSHIPTDRVAVRTAPAQASVPHAPVTFDLGAGARLTMVRVPGGTLNAVSGGSEPMRPFLIGKYEITNAQYRRYAPWHNSRLETGDFLQFSVEERGYPVNRRDQPVCRVSWNEAQAFCRWLSKRTAPILFADRTAMGACLSGWHDHADVVRIGER